MNKRVALINPPSPFLINERVIPNMGLLHVATEMRKGGIDVKVFDFCGDKEYESHMEGVALERFDVYGFSTTTPQFSQTYRLLQILKKSKPKAFTVVGGPHPASMLSLRRAMTLEERSLDPNIGKLEEFDLILGGDGELSHEEIFQSGPKWREMPLIRDLDSIDIPDRSFYDIKSYHYDMDGLESTSIVTQRGCPFKCNFCCGRNIASYRISRVFSSKRILEEMDYLNGEFGFEAFTWQEDEINLNRKRVLELSKLLQKRNYLHKGLVRSDLLVRFPETAEALAESGFIEICSGIETGSDKVLRALGKGTSVETNSRAVELVKNNGMKFKAFIMLGNPTETYDDIMLTRQWLLDYKPDIFDLAIFQPYPGSLIYDDSIPSTRFEDYGYEWRGQLFLNRFDFSENSSFYKGSHGKYESSVRTEELSAEDLVRIRDDLEREVKEKLYGEKI